MPRCWDSGVSFSDLPPLGEGGGETPEAPAVELEAEESEPVLESEQPDDPAAPGITLPIPAERSRRAPQRQRIESGDDDAALGHQHPLGLTQDRVRARAELQDVRQDKKIDALRSERQLHRIGAQSAAALE